LSLPLSARQGNLSSLERTGNLSELEGGVDDTTETFSSDQSSSDRERIHLKVVVEPLAPPPCSDRAKENSVGVARVRAENPGNTDRHPVGEPVTVLLAGSNEPEVLDDSLDSAENTHGDGEVSRRLGNGDAGHGDSGGNSLPSSDGGSSEGADIGGIVAGLVDTRVSRHEEDEDTRSQEDGDESSHGLSVELQLGRSLEEETNSEVADERVGDVGSTRGDVTSDKVDSLSILDGKVALGDTTVNKLRGLGGSSKRSTVSDSTTVDGHESKDNTEDTGEESKTSVHVELSLTDNHGEDESGESAGDPDPCGNLLLSRSKVLDTTVSISLGSLAGEPGVVSATGDEAVVDGASRLVDGELETIEDDLSVEEELDKRVDHEDHDTRPEHPVSGRGDVVRVVDTGHDAESSDAFPLALADLDANALAVVDQKRTDQTPGNNGTTPPRKGSVETDEDTGAEECGGELDVPAPVLRLEETSSSVSRPGVEPGEDVPVVEDAVGVLTNADDEQGNDESNSERLDLADGIVGTGAHSVHGADGHGGGGGSREDEVQLTSDVDDEESSERNSSEETEEGADESDCENAAEILLGVVGEEVETVHGGETGDKDTGHTTGTGSSGLDDGVLLGTELASEEGNVGEGLCEHEDETVTEDGAEHGGRESETSLETKVDVGSVDERSKNDTNNDSTGSQRVGLVLDALGGREAGEEICDALILTVSLGLEVHVDVVRPLLIVARLERVCGETLWDDSFGNHVCGCLDSVRYLNLWLTGWLVSEREKTRH
jgi:hypothetical protein